jgi:hypothetical protein
VGSRPVNGTCGCFPAARHGGRVPVGGGRPVRPVGAGRHAGGGLGRVRLIPCLHRHTPLVSARQLGTGRRMGGDRAGDRAGRRPPGGRPAAGGRPRHRGPVVGVRPRDDGRPRTRAAALVLGLVGGGRGVPAGLAPAGHARCRRRGFLPGSPTTGQRPWSIKGEEL